MRRSGKAKSDTTGAHDAYASGISSIQSVIDDPQLVDRRRAQIVAAATKCFAKNGYHATTVKDICDEGGVSPGLVYQYVKDKHDLLFLTLMHVVNENKKRIPPAIQSSNVPVLRFAAVVRACIAVVDENRPSVMLTYRAGLSLSPEYREALKRLELEQADMIASVIDECIQAGHFLPVDVDMLAYHVLIVAHGWSTKHWRFREISSLEEYIEENLSLILRSVLTEEGRRQYGHLIRPPAIPRRRASKR